MQAFSFRAGDRGLFFPGLFGVGEHPDDDDHQGQHDDDAQNGIEETADDAGGALDQLDQKHHERDDHGRQNDHAGNLLGSLTAKQEKMT